MAFTLDAAGIQSLITDGAYRNLTNGGQSSVAELRIDQAKIDVAAKFKKADLYDNVDFVDANGDFDWTNEEVIVPTLYFAIYYLYNSVENEEMAKNWRQSGQELLSTLINAYAYDRVPNNKPGGDVMPGGMEGGAGGGFSGYETVIYVDEADEDWNGFNEVIT